MKKVTLMSGQFHPPISFDGQHMAFVLSSVWAFVLVVAFFLYENKNKRNMALEILMAFVAALALGASIFFGLVRTDVIL